MFIMKGTHRLQKVEVSKTGVVSWGCTNQQTKPQHVGIQSEDKVLTSGP